MSVKPKPSTDVQAAGSKSSEIMLAQTTAGTGTDYGRYWHGLRQELAQPTGATEPTAGRPGLTAQREVLMLRIWGAAGYAAGHGGAGARREPEPGAYDPHFSASGG